MNIADHPAAIFPLNNSKLSGAKILWCLHVCSGFACNVDEKCDGSCSDVHYRSLPLIFQTTDLVSRLMPVGAPRPTRATAQDVPRDAHFVEQQNLPKLEYSVINSLAGAKENL